jgi:hypothetical protein
MFRMSMGSKSQKQHRTPFGSISRIMSPLDAGPCGTPGNPPCDVERETGKETYKGTKDGVSGTYTKTNYQTDFEIPGKPGGEKPGKPPKTGPRKPFKNPKAPGQTYEEFQAAPYGSPGKTAEKYKPKTKTYGEKKRSDLKFVPNTPPPDEIPTPKKEKQLPSGGKVPGKGRKSLKIGKPSLSMGPRTKRGGSKRSGNSCGCAVNN